MGKALKGLLERLAQNRLGLCAHKEDCQPKADIIISGNLHDPVAQEMAEFMAQKFKEIGLTTAVREGDGDESDSS